MTEITHSLFLFAGLMVAVSLAAVFIGRWTGAHKLQRDIHIKPSPDTSQFQTMVKHMLNSMNNRIADLCKEDEYSKGGLMYGNDLLDKLIRKIEKAYPEGKPSWKASGEPDTMPDVPPFIQMEAESDDFEILSIEESHRVAVNAVPGIAMGISVNITFRLRDWNRTVLVWVDRKELMPLLLRRWADEMNEDNEQLPYLRGSGKSKYRNIPDPADTALPSCGISTSVPLLHQHDPKENIKGASFIAICKLCKNKNEVLPGHAGICGVCEKDLEHVPSGPPKRCL